MRVGECFFDSTSILHTECLTLFGVRIFDEKYLTDIRQRLLDACEQQQSALASQLSVVRHHTRGHARVDIALHDVLRRVALTAPTVDPEHDHRHQWIQRRICDDRVQVDVGFHVVRIGLHERLADAHVAVGTVDVADVVEQVVDLTIDDLLPGGQASAVGIVG